MTADSLRDAIAEALADHGYRSPGACRCGFSDRTAGLGAYNHRAHVADVVAGVVGDALAAMETERDWWRDKFNVLFDEHQAEYKRHRASPLASGEGNVHTLQVRVTEKWLRKINRWRKPRDLSVSAACRELIEAGLDAALSPSLESETTEEQQ